MRLGVRAFVYNSTESEPIWVKSGTVSTLLGGWPWQISGAIRAVVTAGEPGKKCFVR